LAFYRRKQSRIAVRHVSGDIVVAMIEIVSPGNKSTRLATREFAEKSVGLVAAGIHLLVADVLPPTSACPESIHAAIWDELQGESSKPLNQQLALTSYEATEAPRAFVEPVAVGEPLPSMPLFLKPGAHIAVPLEATYLAAFDALPQRWTTILER
jgi:hypothetical protein